MRLAPLEAASRTMVSALSIFSCTWLQHENCSAAIFIFLSRMDRSYRLHLVLPATILQHPLLPQRGSQYPHRHHDLGRLLPDGDQRIKTLISNALALGSNGLFLDMQESGNALFFTSKRRRLLLLIDF